MKSSTNFINGDISAVQGSKLSIFKKALYFFFFLKEFFFERKVKAELDLKINSSEIDTFLKTSDWNIFSPSRLACTAYIIDFLSKNFSKDKEIKMIDIGCGSGRYYHYFTNLGYQINYLGLDIKKSSSWNDSSEKLSFFEIELGENKIELLNRIEDKLKNIDLVFSHSALEHIENDISAVREISKFCKEAKHLHLVPAVSMFPNELLHGWRRYAPRNLKKFGKDLSTRIVFDPIGNKKTFKSFFSYHYKLDAKKLSYDFFNFYKHDYDPRRDIETISSPNIGEFPVFYALIINPNEEVD